MLLAHEGEGILTTGVALVRAAAPVEDFPTLSGIVCLVELRSAADKTEVTHGGCNEEVPSGSRLRGSGGERRVVGDVGIHKESAHLVHDVETAVVACHELPDGSIGRSSLTDECFAVTVARGIAAAAERRAELIPIDIVGGAELRHLHFREDILTTVIRQVGSASPVIYLIRLRALRLVELHAAGGDDDEARGIGLGDGPACFWFCCRCFQRGVVVGNRRNVGVVCCVLNVPSAIGAFHELPHGRFGGGGVADDFGVSTL